jgi:hypothetical protein
MDNDVVLAHGRWCLSKMIHPSNIRVVQDIMEARIKHLTAHPEAFAPSLPHLINF